MSDNRRTSTRHPVDLPCLITLEADEAGLRPSETRIVNLSVGGALVRWQRLPLGARVSVTFKIATLEDNISTGAVVRWSTDDEVGIQFDGLRPRDVWALSKLFESLP